MGSKAFASNLEERVAVEGVAHLHTREEDGAHMRRGWGTHAKDDGTHAKDGTHAEDGAHA